MNFGLDLERFDCGGGSWSSGHASSLADGTSRFEQIIEPDVPNIALGSSQPSKPQLFELCA